MSPAAERTDLTTELTARIHPAARGGAGTTSERCEAAGALAARALTWGSDAELPTAADAIDAVNVLNAYGEELRNAVRAAAPHDAVPHLLDEADSRLGLSLTPVLPTLPFTPQIVVHRAQNLARLIQGLLNALDAAPVPIARHGQTHHRKDY
ncbi:hypothetical protein ACH41E_02980 [Streptomyces sp. NPDC020412]|uniref:hypothetical protein n=1 Tax=Streptomyces sp. NPDC020412 TaxID=3365073 RepID=UPI00378E453A